MLLITYFSTDRVLLSTFVLSEDDNIIISDYTLHLLFPPQLKNIVKIQGYVWLRMLHIFQKYAFIITIMTRSLLKKTQVSQLKFSKQKDWGKSKFTYMKHIKYSHATWA